MDEKKINTAISIVRNLVRNGYIALFAGGYVRDRIFGLDKNKEEDIDIATNATPKEISGLFKKVIGVGEQFGVMLVIENNISFEVATFRKDCGVKNGRHPEKVIFSNIEADALRRDFTINGLYYDPLKQQMIDIINGVEDLKKGIIRTIGNPDHRFMEDYLRLLRAIRFSARFQFSIEDKTWDSIRKNASKISYISAERIYQELTKIITGSHPEKAVELLDQSGLLKEILPEVHALKGVMQPKEYHPEGDVFTHTLKTLSFIKKSSPTTAWSALLHDIGKPLTQTNTDRIRFNNHHRKGASMARSILTRLKTSRRFSEDVYSCIENHMNFMNVKKMRLSTLKKLLLRSTFENELELHYADCMASHGDIENYLFLKEKKKEIKELTHMPKPLLRGKDLIDLGFKPGPVFGVFLKELYDLQLNEKINTKNEAIAWIMKEKNKF
ncbi:MAG: CCA tRNA nucleotidyltransferase [Chitinispirillia bacterium]|jgi:poly(A) polymerase